MTSTFFGLGIAASGLNSFQAKLNTTANNGANRETEGYSRQQVNVSSAISLRAYTPYGAISTGVSTNSVSRVRDQYYNVKYWENQSNYGQYTVREYYMKQVEQYFTDSSTNPGFSTLYSKMFIALDSVKSNAGEDTRRASFISSAQQLCDYFNQSAQNLSTLQTDANDQVKETVDQINSIAKKISVLNKQINQIETQAGNPNANELRDQRELLIDQLSELATVETEEIKVKDSRTAELAKFDPNVEVVYTGATTFTVKLGNQLLVDNYDYNPLEVTTRENRYNQSDVDGLYEVSWAKKGRYNGESLNLFGTNMGGKLRGLLEIRDGNNEENLTGVAELATYAQADKDHPAGSVGVNGEIYTDDAKLVGAQSASYIKLSQNISITDPDRMNMPEQGTIRVNGHSYDYTSFTAQTDDDGKIVNYVFQLKSDIPVKAIGTLAGKKASVGSSVDFKGVPYYQNEMNAFLRTFSEAFNKIQKSGQDANGGAGRSIFVARNTSQSGDGSEYDFTGSDSIVDNEYYLKDAAGNPTTDLNTKRETVHKAQITGTSDSYYKLTAASIKIADEVKRSPMLFSATIHKKYNGNKDLGYDAYDLMQGMLDLQDKTTLYKDGTGEKFLQRIYADVTVDTQECKQFAANYTAIQSSIDTQRQSVSGVDDDEVAMDLVKFQNAYNLSSKVISTLAEMYDQLILNTGV